MSYRIGICEDEKIYQDSLTEMVNSICQDNGIQVKIQTFSSIKRLKNFMNDPLESSLDLVLLDIFFDDKEEGLNYAKELRDNNDKTKIIFITNSGDFALEG